MNEKQVQYTVRKVPERIDSELRKRADQEGKSLNEVTIEVLERGLGLVGEGMRYHDMDDLAGTWVDDPDFDAAIEAMDQVDREIWR